MNFVEWTLLVLSCVKRQSFFFVGRGERGEPNKLFIGQFPGIKELINEWYTPAVWWHTRRVCMECQATCHSVICTTTCGIWQPVCQMPWLQSLQITTKNTRNEEHSIHGQSCLARKHSPRCFLIFPYGCFHFCGRFWHSIYGVSCGYWTCATLGTNIETLFDHELW